MVAMTVCVGLKVQDPEGMDDPEVTGVGSAFTIAMLLLR